jgi:Lytic transglycolase
LIVALLKRKAENPVAALERELSDLTARRAALEVKLTDAAGALAVAVDERRRRRSSNRNNGMSAVVTINDRGPFVRGRVIDLTPAAAAVKWTQVSSCSLSDAG